MTAPIRIAVSAVAVGIILWRIPLPALWTAFKGLDTAWLWLVLATVLAMLIARWVRWHSLLKAGNVSVSQSDAARSLLGGFALSVVMPGRVGELGRFLFLPKSARASALLLNIVDRALDMWALATFMVGSLFVVLPRPTAIFAVAVWLVLLPFAMGLPNLVSRLGGLPWWREAFRAQLRDAGKSLVSVPTPRFAAWALASTALDLVAFYCLLCAFQNVDFRVALAAFPWIVTAGGLPVSVAGLGTREGAAVISLAAFGVAPAVATDAGFLLFAFTGLLPASLGGAWALVHQARQSWLGAPESRLPRPAAAGPHGLRRTLEA